MNENFATLFDAFDQLLVRDDTTITVAGGDCEQLRVALRRLDARRIAGNATVRVEFAPGTFACPDPIELRHPDGDRVHLVGTGADRDDMTLTFPAGSDGLVIRSALGRIENLVLTSSGDVAMGGLGVHVSGGRVHVQGVTVHGFQAGFRVVSGALTAENVTLRGNRLGASVLRGGQLTATEIVGRREELNRGPGSFIRAAPGCTGRRSSRSATAVLDRLHGGPALVRGDDPRRGQRRDGGAVSRRAGRGPSVALDGAAAAATERTQRGVVAVDPVLTRRAPSLLRCARARKRGVLLGQPLRNPRVRRRRLVAAWV
ncbi:MAG: hypothetical protein KF901_10290 [Myxococcales bacterium]|nr:hypothetical protein [Myxococcales bacterium]